MKHKKSCRPRVMLLIRTLSGAGAELVVESLCKNIDKNQFEVSVCELHGHGEKAVKLRASGFPVYSLNPNEDPQSPFRGVWRLRQLLRRHRIDLIHSHSTDALADGAVCGLTLPSLRHIHTFHFGNYPHHGPTHLRLERIFHRFADQLVAVGHGQADAIARTYSIKKTQLQVIWNGIERREAHVDHELLGSHEQGGKVLIGTLGTLIEQKGHVDLIGVAAEIRRKKLSAVFLIVGDGPLREVLEASVRERQLQDTVVFLGWVKDAAETVLPALDIFFQPSRWEAMSMVLLEAAAAGKAIVCTSVGDARQVISHGKTGFIVPPQNKALMIESLETLIEDASLRAALGKAARANVEEHFLITKMTKKYEDLYWDTLRPSQKRGCEKTSEHVESP